VEGDRLEPFSDIRVRFLNPAPSDGVHSKQGSITTLERNSARIIEDSAQVHTVKKAREIPGFFVVPPGQDGD
jgi:hypothetical protein